MGVGGGKGRTGTHCSTQRWIYPQPRNKKIMEYYFELLIPATLLKVFAHDVYEIRSCSVKGHEHAYARFRIASCLGKEVLTHDVYTKDELHTYCACAVFFAKTARTQSWECYDHMFGCILRFFVWKVFM